MLTIAVCDDEEQVLDELSEMIETIGRRHKIPVEVELFSEGKSLFQYMKVNQTKFDLIFLDIEMDDLNGIDTAKEIRKWNDSVYIIYVTNYKSYAYEAYETYPYQFVLKPIKLEIIEKHLLKIYNRITSDDFYYEYKYNKSYYKVFMKEIIYFESDRRKIHIHLADGNVYTYYDKLNLVEDRLKKTKADFWRIHQSLLVNSRYIRRKSYDRIELSDGEIFYISEDRRKDINKQYAKLIEDACVEKL